MTASGFDAYLASLTAVASQQVAAEPDALELCIRATEKLATLRLIDRPKLAEAVGAEPEIVPVVAAAAGFSQERFRTWLQGRFGTAGWTRLGRERGDELVSALDEDFAIVALLEAQVAREWTWADVLARSMAPRQRAGSAIRQGRDLENAVERVIEGVGLPFAPRTRFEGTGTQTAPADFAVPEAGSGTLIAVAVKGFDSTGSKLGDAAREIEEMAKVRRPTQFIFAVVDGHGWLRRQGDLRRIHALWIDRRIDGLYTRATLPAFRQAVTDAARRLGLT